MYEQLVDERLRAFDEFSARYLRAMVVPMSDRPEWRAVLWYAFESGCNHGSLEQLESQAPDQRGQLPELTIAPTGKEKK